MLFWVRGGFHLTTLPWMLFLTGRVLIMFEMSMFVYHGCFVTVLLDSSWKVDHFWSGSLLFQVLSHANSSETLPTLINAVR